MKYKNQWYLADFDRLNWEASFWVKPGDEDLLMTTISREILELFALYGWYKPEYKGVRLYEFFDADFIRESMNIRVHRDGVRSKRFFDIDPDLLRTRSGVVDWTLEEVKFFSLSYYEEKEIVTIDHSEKSFCDFMTSVGNHFGYWHPSGFLFNDDIYGYPVSFSSFYDALPRDDEGRMVIGFDISSPINIWFTEINNMNLEVGEDVVFDNTALALKNTPRLNGLISSIKNLVDQYSGNWKLIFARPGSDKVTENGVLIGDKLIL